MNTKELDNQYVAHAYRRFDVALTKGQGSTLYDENGKKYIDFGSGIGVTAFGINDPVWTKAVEEQLHRVQHTSNLYYTAPCAKLAQLLCEKSGMKKVFFGNSGAEANEGAIKFARKYSFDKYGAGRSTIITLVNSFHGRTITTLAATGQDSFHTVFDPFTPGFKYCPANDIEALQAAATDDVCAVLFECVQGEGGVNNLSPTFVSAIAKLAKEKDILIAVDEVQTGNGRTGTYFAYQ
jgi:acetylornithine/N-succinyldiaminopimelate aminotransferase